MTSVYAAKSDISESKSVPFGYQKDNLNEAELLSEMLMVGNIALDIIAEHGLEDELKNKVKSDCKSDSTTYQKNQIEPQGQHI